MSTVLLTGAAGRIGAALAPRLRALGWDVRAFDREPLDGGVTGDITSPADLDAAMAGVDAVVHLAGQPTEAPWPVLRDANVEGVFQVFEAARRAGVERVVWASSNHAAGFTPTAPELPAATLPRPDTLYGVTKAFGEALARYYVDRYGMRVACLRIGSFGPRPQNTRALATWLSPDDCAALVDGCLRSAQLTFALIWGVSANTRRSWSLDNPVGWVPRDDAEPWAADVEAPVASDALVGGPFTESRFGIDEVRVRTDAAAWVADEVDPSAAAEVQALIDDDDLPELADRFRGPLTFGTAGLRGPLRAGPNGMNRVVVRRAAAGIAAWLGADPRPVVIGYDARHGSLDFARDSAGVLTAAGLEARLLPRVLPTPVLAFAVGHLGAAAGIMVTASHNPPQDNGYKVYAGDGTQIVPPADTDIEAAIRASGPAREIPLADGAVVLDEEIVDAYVGAVAGLVADGPRDVRIVHTAMHGVGTETLRAVFARAGFALTPVPQQEQPDPDFPTVAFPNPEEPGALDLALALAREQDADLVLANDPDADRCAVAVPGPDGWRMLRGDEVGVLLADAMLRAGVRGTYATTIVSSSLLGAMARRHGAGYAETLTGFKWISRAAPDLVFGYEEALGYAVAPQLVRDKDGISAALRVAELAATLRAEGSSLLGRLDAIAAEYGRYATDQVSVRVADLSQIAATMRRLRADPPTRLLGGTVEAEDLLPRTDGLRWRCAGGRVVVRPSGTEPKLKAYLEVVEADGSAEAAAAALARLRAEVEPLVSG